MYELMYGVLMARLWRWQLYFTAWSYHLVRLDIKMHNMLVDTRCNTDMWLSLVCMHCHGHDANLQNTLQNRHPQKEYHPVLKLWQALVDA